MAFVTLFGLDSRGSSSERTLSEVEQMIFTKGHFVSSPRRPTGKDMNDVGGRPPNPSSYVSDSSNGDEPPTERVHIERCDVGRGAGRGGRLGNGFRRPEVGSLATFSAIRSSATTETCVDRAQVQHAARRAGSVTNHRATMRVIASTVALAAAAFAVSSGSSGGPSASAFVVGPAVRSARRGPPRHGLNPPRTRKRPRAMAVGLFNRRKVDSAQTPSAQPPPSSAPPPPKRPSGAPPPPNLMVSRSSVVVAYCTTRPSSLSTADMGGGDNRRRRGHNPSTPHTPLPPAPIRSRTLAPTPPRLGLRTLSFTPSSPRPLA